MKQAAILSTPIFRTLALFLWMGVIFAFSSIPGSPYPFDPTISYFLERKGAHLIEYAILTVLAVRFFWILFPKENFRLVLALAALLSIAFGATDELHQFFVPRRGAKMTDVLIDGLGVSLTVATFLLLESRYKKRTKVVSKRK